MVSLYYILQIEVLILLDALNGYFLEMHRHHLLQYILLHVLLVALPSLELRVVG